MKMKYFSYDAESLLKSTEINHFANRRKPDGAYGLEIQSQSGFGLHTCCGCPSQPIPLYKYHNAPDFLHGNPFVIQGYRGKLPLVLCLQR